MSEKMTEEDSRRKWPGIEHAYAFVLPSYQWMLTRYEAADSRIQTLMAFVATVTLAIPAWLRSASVTSAAPQWLSASAIGCGVGAVAVGLVGRNIGHVWLASPDILRDKWTRDGEWTFKSEMLYFAGAHFLKNERTIRVKANLSRIMTVLFLGEIALFLVWVFQSTF
jgi:hypothetical protein